MRSLSPYLKKIFFISALSAAPFLHVAGQPNQGLASDTTTAQTHETVRAAPTVTSSSAKDRAAGLAGIFALAALSLLGPAYMIDRQRKENARQAREADKLLL